MSDKTATTKINPHFSGLINLKVIFVFLGESITFHAIIFFLIVTKLKASHYLIAIFMADELHSLVSPTQTFIARSHHATSMETNHSFLPRIYNVRRKSDSEIVFLI